MKYTNILFLAFVIFLLAFLFIFIPKIIKVNKIKCFNQYGECEKNMYNILSRSKAKSLEESFEEVKNIISLSPLVKDFSIQYQIPDELVVRIIVKKPKYALSNRGAKALGLVDREGMVVGFVDFSLLPKLTTEAQIPDLGEKIGAKEFFSLEILSYMSYLYGVNEAKLTGDGLVFDLPENMKIVFPAEGDGKKLVGSTRIIISRLNEGWEDLRIEDVRQIDMRFKNPVIKTAFRNL